MSERQTSKPSRAHSPALIVIGGFAGSGKTAISHRLACELRLPRLGGDTIGRTIRASEGIQEALAADLANPQWIAYDVLLALTEEYLRCGVSTILDMTMGWAFQWERIDDILTRSPGALYIPLILRCPRPICLSRILQRYTAHPEHYDPPEVYVTDPRMQEIWDHLEQLERPEVRWIDASRPLEEVYAQVKATLVAQGKAQA